MFLCMLKQLLDIFTYTLPSVEAIKREIWSDNYYEQSALSLWDMPYLLNTVLSLLHQSPILTISF
jgi:hypothetical protein